MLSFRRSTEVLFFRDARTIGRECSPCDPPAMTRHGHTPRTILNESPAAIPSRACVGLALGGGFARSVAHLGVLQGLEQNHIPISHTPGTTVGSTLGAPYAAGPHLSSIMETFGPSPLRSMPRWT